MFSKKNKTSNPNAAVTPLAEADRIEHPTVIYSQGTNSIEESQALLAALSGASEHGLRFVLDAATDPDTGIIKTIVRTAEDDRQHVKFESALFHGAAALASRALAEAIAVSEAERRDSARDLASKAIGQILGNEALSSGFEEFYGGLRWSSDQERFISTLFEAAEELDLAVIERMFASGRDLSSVVYYADLDISYEERREWVAMTALEVFESRPELDYRKLADPEFLATAEGVTLAKAYSRCCGQVKADIYKRQGGRHFDEHGKVLPKPSLPLSKFPLIESLIIDDILMTTPSAKYSFGPSDVSGIILSSDSLPAQQALVATIINPDTLGLPTPYDGISVLDQKHILIRDALNAYQEQQDPSVRAIFKEHIIQIIGAYTGEGSIASTVRDNFLANDGNRRFDKTIPGVKAALKDILRVAITSADAEVFFGRYVLEDSDSYSDPLALSKAELEEVIIDSLKQCSILTDAEVFESIARRVFDDDVARQLREIVELRVAAHAGSVQPEVRLARMKWANDSSDYKSPERVELKNAFLAADADNEHKRLAAVSKLNDVLLGLINEALADGASGLDSKRLKNFISQIYLGDYQDMEVMPPIYHQLMAFAGDPRTPLRVKTDVLYKISEHYKYAGESSGRALTNYLVDGYRLILGDPNRSLEMPDSEASLGLGAVNMLAKGVVLKEADQTQLFELSLYKGRLMELAENLGARQLTVESGAELSIGDRELLKENVRILQRVMEAFNKLEDAYKDFLHMEDVKELPHVYYPWVIKNLASFWNGMQREVSPDNRPNLDIIKLHRALEELVQNKLVIEDTQEEGFDVFEQGHLDVLIRTGYRHMALSRDIGYNNTVWRMGLPYLHMAISYMPESVVDLFKKKYAHEPDFLEYLAKIRNR